MKHKQHRIFFWENLILLWVKITLGHQNKTEDIDDENVKGFLLKTEDCTIPELDAFHSSIKPFLVDKMPQVCTNGSTVLVEQNLTSIYIVEKAYTDYYIIEENLLMCCYTAIWRKSPTFRNSDFKIMYSRRCEEFSKSAIITHELIKVECFYDSVLIYTDYFIFISLKTKRKTYGDGLNVLVIGLDSLSRLNFHRQMPRTVSVLKKLGGVEFLGFNKVADDLVSNLAPLLAGMYHYNFGECLPRRRIYFDKYPFIWKAFNEKNYITAYIQDIAQSFTCFSKHPTEYDWRIFTAASMDDRNGSCLGARETYLVQLDYLQTFLGMMRGSKQNYFGFFWESSLSQNILNIPKVADAKYSDLIMQMNKSGSLTDTVLFVLSNHGVKDEALLHTFQGKLENKLPFLSIYLPPLYRTKFPMAYRHLTRNKRRLVTSFDVYYTLMDLVEPFKLTTDFLTQRNQTKEWDKFHSLFDVVSKKRTCSSVRISSKLCAC